MKYYKKLEKLMNKWSSLYGASMILHWDSRTMIPKRSHLLRSEQISLLSTMQHEILASNEIIELLSYIDMSMLNDWQQSNIREICRLHTMATKIPKNLINRFAKATTRCEKLWHVRTNQVDQKYFEESFEEVVILTREMAYLLADGLGLSVYDTLLEQQQPGLRDHFITPIFNQIELFTSNFVSIRNSLPEEENNWPRIPKDQQIKFVKKLMSEMKFDFRTGRLDESAHPFTGGIPGDIRVCSYFKPDNIILSISAIMHEIGHASYESRLPKKFRGQPVGDSRGMCIHEGIALLFEKQIGHSKEYLEYLSKKLNKQFGYLNYFNKENLLHHFNTIRRSGIRVSADDFTYSAHILIRYKIEKELIAGELSVKNLNNRWCDLYNLYLGITPSLYEDPWQDIHWAIGLFGYFPCYLIGNVISSQLFNKAQEEISIKQEINQGKFNKLQKWLDEKIYKKSSYFEFEDLIISSCGKALSANDFIDNLKARLS
ncbi:carboxypeptidase M32 [Xenorhabdus nematophila]|nr:carboxypeptidase M32 [Xenorhabdus nematophila]CCW31919.1 putative Thermostable carboxypeptidase 1 (Carboxypeptidase Taq) [Xenorhabdus nematophila F1]CEE90728.1 putative Thermostable carboxypeptidase 1 (Carboxypeptidase Taq) [Xenorhabdus nematophila str. Anatoliense]CEE95092.1 putative Thermostable carboxypeptidase 1 (Carboxypeptidase Taq) [Xenorhabdus nematophila str. Anatoliense]CEK21599.1 putative Thermostable carboxypeptidase 1 (Carboxypeptidase Taq) [Xenorhabdus nematophila AN6/1]